MASVLIVDDDKTVVCALEILLKQAGHRFQSLQSPEKALALVKQVAFDVALLDMNYSADTTGGEEGLALIQKFQYFNPDMSIVVMTGWSSVELAVKSLQAGANDFIEKPWDNQRLLSIVKNQALLCKKDKQQAALRSENSLLQAELNHNSPRDFATNSKAMQKLLRDLNKIAKSDVSVFITGENGTGKSALAQHIHHLSNRNLGKFVSVNAGAISESLFESEMFGHIRGAFTDAKENRIGRLELADQGTLFIDEIGNLALPLQAKLLRALEEKQFEKVGSSITLNTDARIVCATNADIHRLIARGEFRQDLLYRLNSIELHLPPLRERREDILDLAKQFLQSYCAQHGKTPLVITEEARQALLNYAWPGNIRELQHVIERSVILCSGSKVEQSDLALGSQQQATPAQNTQPLLNGQTQATLEDIERQVIEQRILLNGGNMSKAARSLGLSRSAFYRRLEKLAIK
ncbi:MAG: sigma-54 dependent transcriptional regulator [Cellvibrionaceae bacterium]|nr:sigma-54 dependent transcriptional regulator [Cellvibrionaceae bacterium]